MGLDPALYQILQTGMQYHQAGNLEMAESLYRKVLAAAPAEAEAVHLLGLLLVHKGQSAAGIELVRSAVRLAPRTAIFRHNLGHLLLAGGDARAATEEAGRACELNPQSAEMRNTLGRALGAGGNSAGAMAAFREAVRLQPAYAEAWSNLSVALTAAGDHAEAIQAARRAVELQPTRAEFHSNVGIALRSAGELAAAAEAFHRAFSLNPNLTEAGNNLGNALRELGQPLRAIDCLRGVVQGAPTYAEGWNTLGSALQDAGQLDEAIEAFSRAIELQPNYALAHSNRGVAEKDRGEVDRAVSCFRQALQADPHSVAAHSNLLLTLLYHPGYDAAALHQEQRRWQEQHAAQLEPVARVAGRQATAPRRLRIGYVSADFRDHVVGRNVLPLFREHDHAAFEVFGYSSVLRPDSLTAEFQRRCDQWRPVAALSDLRLAELIATDRIDILVDLSQHTAGHRLLTFARTPAAIQVSFAGYPASTGLAAIPHRLTDRYLEPGNPPIREHLIRLESFWCYDPVDLPVGSRAVGQPITFGCLNNPCKVSEPSLRLWAALLAAVPEARLILTCASRHHADRLTAFFSSRSISADRIELAPPLPRRQYLQSYHRIDVILDTLPYNGHTTSLDALWMGVPVVTLAGQTPVGRAGVSQLTNLGLVELIASDEEAYLEIAQNLAREPRRLETLRARLRDRMRQSILCDATRFARQIEEAYQALWSNSVSG